MTENITRLPFLAVLAMSLCALAACNVGAGSGDLRSDVERYIGLLAADGRFNGVVLMARGGEVVVHSSVGIADRESGTSMTADSIFDIGSVAKLFTAVLIMQMVESDDLALDDSPAQYVEELSGSHWADVTIRDLMSHRAGVIDHGDIPGYFEGPVITGVSREELIGYLSESSLLFAPGADYRYSNFGYSLLAIVAERLSGVPWPELLKERIFDPAGLRQTRWNDVHEIVPGRADGYVRAFGGAMRKAPFSAASLGAGDILSTARDLWRFQRALDDGTLLSKASLEQMFRHQAWNSLRGRGHGLGWELYGAEDHVSSVGHGGAALGFLTILEWGPESDYFFAILNNIRDHDDVINNVPPPLIRRMQQDLRDFVTGEAVEMPKSSLAEEFLKIWEQLGYEKAISSTELLLQRHPQSWRFSETEYMLAAYAMSDSRPAEAELLLEYAFERSADENRWLMLEALGDIRTIVYDVQGALEAYRSAQELRPDREYLQQRIHELEGPSG